MESILEENAITLTIDLTPMEGRRLTDVARQTGLDPKEAARQMLVASLMPPSEREKKLVEEYHALLSVERQGRGSQAQAERRRQVEAEIDELEAQDPMEQAMDRRLQETSDKLDEVLELLHHLPKKTQRMGSAVG